MKKTKIFFLLCIILQAQISTAQTGNADVVFLKNNFSKIVSKDTKIEKLADGFKFTEGPVWHTDGYLLFSDIPENKIFKYIPGEGISIYLDNSGYLGSDAEIKGQGSNGLTFDENGNLIICQHGARQLLKADRAGNFTPIARQYKGKRLNSPNDVVVKSDGAIFFTDPPYGLAQRENDPEKELDFQGLFRLFRGSLEVVDTTLARPNGIALSPDEKYLYVTNSEGNKKHYYRFELKEDGSIGNKTLFFDATNIEGQGGPDGIKVDKQGNCYFTGPGGVLVISPKGEHLGTIAPPESPANLCWGGKDGKTLFMTCRTGLYAINLKIEGVRPMK
jgi:gluconolactonase